MPRAARAIVDGGCYHVLNRGNARAALFHKPGDFEAFVRVLGEAQQRYPAVKLLAWCLMTNHWHLVLRPRRAAALADFMRWVGVTHVRRHHARYHRRGGGHLYQGRFKSFPIQLDGHLLTVLRYVEANPLRAGLVRRAEAWAWSSLGYRPPAGEAPLVTCAPSPIGRPRDWAALVNAGVGDDEAAAIRTSIQRDRPYGSDQWVRRTVARLGLESTLRPRGRPPKEPK